VPGPSVAESRLRIRDKLSQQREYAHVEVLRRVLRRLAVQTTFFALLGTFGVPLEWTERIEYSSRTM
jgi:hypothetical protein